MAFAILSVLSTFLLGMLLALLFNDPRLRGKAIYRSVLILPYALPGFVTALVWKGMFNQDYGIINQITGLDVDWLGNAGRQGRHPHHQPVAGLPLHVHRLHGRPAVDPRRTCARRRRIDGAGAFRTLRSIIMPLLLVAVGPLLLASFAFNFNNFGLIYLLHQGRALQRRGHLDRLERPAHHLRLSPRLLAAVHPTTASRQQCPCSSSSLVALMSIPGFRRTKALEEIN